LINNQRDTVLSLLESMNVQGRSGLDILIQTWCENAETFQGFWPSRISTMALCQLFVSERPSLQNLMVKGDIIVKPETQNGQFCFALRVADTELSLLSYHDTVSYQAQYAERNFLVRKQCPIICSLGPHEFSSIPFPVKALKLLLHDVQSGGESATITAQGDAYEVDSDDGVSWATGVHSSNADS
jgi:hypothetical protein